MVFVIVIVLNKIQLGSLKRLTRLIGYSWANLGYNYLKVIPSPWARLGFFFIFWWWPGWDSKYSRSGQSGFNNPLKYIMIKYLIWFHYSLKKSWQNLIFEIWKNFYLQFMFLSENCGVRGPSFLYSFNFENIGKNIGLVVYSSDNSIQLCTDLSIDIA